MGPISYILASLVVPTFLCLLSLCLYRALSHPLAKYPGPLVARITDWYNVYHAWKGDRHIDIHRLHQQYGDIVRYGPDRISINTAVGLHEIYGARSSVQKSRLYEVFESFFKVASSGSIVDKVQHGSRSRLIKQALTVPAVKSMERMILDNIGQFCDQLSKPQDGAESIGRVWSAGKNMTEWTARLTIEIIGGLLFGQTWTNLDWERKRAFLETIPAGTKGFLMAGHMPAILTLKMDRIFLRRLTSRARKFQSVTKWQMEQRLAAHRDEVKTDDLFDKLLTARDSNTGRGLTHADIHAEAMTFMVAGSDTMATTMTATLFYLLHYPSTLHRLRDEIDSSFQSVEDIVMGSQLSSCTYLRACLDETLRLNPPVGGVLPREVLKGGITIDGNFFPAGTDIGTSLYALQRQESYFHNASSYEPQRWIVDQASKDDSKPVPSHVAFNPFSLGPRGCPAKAMAYAEMMVTLARMVFLLDMRLGKEGLSSMGGGASRPGPPLFQTKDFFVSTHDGPMVQFRKRERKD